MSMEVQIFLAKFLADPRRNEPRNVGLIVRTAADEVATRFLLDDEKTRSVPKKLDIQEYAAAVGEWQKAITKYGVKALQWIGKRKKPGQKFYIEFIGGLMVQEFDMDKLFEELVL